MEQLFPLPSLLVSLNPILLARWEGVAGCGYLGDRVVLVDWLPWVKKGWSVTRLARMKREWI